MLQKTFWTTLAVITATITALLLSLPTPQADIGSGDSNNRFAIESVRLFDGENISDSTTVVVENGLILEIGEGIDISNAQVIDGSGKTLLPGLIDAHTHSFGAALQDTIKFGVTTHLDMFTDSTRLKSAKSSRQSSLAKQQADLFSAGVLATAPAGHGTQFGIPIETLNSPAQAETWVAKRLAEGSDFIKLVYMPNNSHFASLDRATAAAVINAAHQNGVLAVAHISTLADAQDLLDDGIDGLVHIFADKIVTPEFLAQAKKQKLFVIPTLSVISAVSRKGLAQGLANDPRVATYLSLSQQQQLIADFGGGEWPGFDFQIALDNTRRMHEAGIPILAGSDAPNRGTAYGASLHQEMALLVKAGLTSNEALKAATSAPVDAFGITDRGRIKPGQRADLILVDGNPNTSINDSLSIHAIYKNGQRIERLIAEQATASSPIESSVLSNFQRNMEGPAGFAWSKTDDSMMNGASTVTLALDDESLKVNAKVNSGFMFPWAGAGLFSDSSVDISRFNTLEFRIRGTAGRYQVMTFSSVQAGAPPSQNFQVSKDWQTVRLSLADFRGLSTENFIGLAITAGPAIGQFEYYLKSVKLK